MPDSARPAYVGWVRTSALGEKAGPPTHRIHSLSAPVFSRADLKSPILMSLPAASLARVIAQEEGGYLQVGAGAWISALHARSLDRPASSWLASAQLYIGQPYAWGGTGARGVDCSGLVQMSLALCGIDAPRDADQQEAALGEPVALDAPWQAGDLLFWPGHVGILSAPDRLLHANATHMSVVEEPLQPALQRIDAAGTPLRSVRRMTGVPL
ncbi:MAG: C40 family peptidase [Litorimonas sp.]